MHFLFALLRAVYKCVTQLSSPLHQENQFNKAQTGI